MSDLTHVELLWLEKRIENWIRFGRVAAEQILDRRRRVVSFAPGSIFAFVRWTSSDYGTVISKIDMLRLSGWPKVERVLQLIDAVEALGINAADAAPDYWHHAHNRLSVGEAPRSYTRSRHQIWLQRRKIAP